MIGNSPIIYIDYVTNDDGSQYHRIEYKNGCVETTPRNVWVEACPHDCDMWRSDSLGKLYGAARREAELTKG